jgi:ComEC/Rec2-related protein
MKRPLVSVVVAYAAGLLIAQIVEVPATWLLAASFLFLAAAVLLTKARPYLLWPLLLLAGWVNFAVHTQIISPHDLRVVLPDQPALATVRGKLVETPSQRVYVRDETESWRSLARLNVTALNRGQDWQPASGQIIVMTPDVLPPEYFAGQAVEISGVMAPPDTPVAAGLFDYQTFLRRQGIYFQLKAGSPNDWKLFSTNNATPLCDRFLKWSQATLARGLPAQDEPLKLLWAMTLGWRPALTDEVSEPFMKSGTMHIFAISGLHIALIAGILIALLRVLQRPRFWCGMVVIPLIWFYTAATGWQPSAIRSTIMMTIVIGGWMLKRPGDILNSLAAAALVILTIDPLQLFQASFQLSFFVVLSIALFMPPLEKLRDRLLRTDPLLPNELLPKWRRWLNAIARVGLTWLAVSFAAWLGSWPLVAYYFHLFSPVTLLANLLIVPLSGAALASNIGSLICGDWLPWIGELFNFSGWFWMKLMETISQSVIKLPRAFFYVSGPTAVDFVFYYCGLVAMLTGVAFKRPWRVPMLTLIVVMATFYGWRWHETRQTNTLTVLPLNGGHAVFFQPGNSSQNLLVDCGDSNAVEFVTKPFLHAHGINHLPRMALTQGDLRDMGGAPEMCDLFSVNQVITSPARFRSAIYRQTMIILEETNDRRVIVKPDDSIGLWRVIYPPATNRFSQADDNSLVLLGQIAGLEILLLSDLGQLGQEALLNQTNDLRAAVVIAGLPEKSEPLSDGLLEKIQPEIVVIADSLFPATKRASPALQERLRQHGFATIFTRNSGAITIIAKPGGWELRTMRGQLFTSAAFGEIPRQTAPRE